MRFNGADYSLHPRHDCLKINIRLQITEAQLTAVAQIKRMPGRPEKRFARHTTGIQAIAPHFVLFNQRYPGFDGRRDQCRHQSTGACADDHQVTIKLPGTLKTPIDPAGF